MSAAEKLHPTVTPANDQSDDQVMKPEELAELLQIKLKRLYEAVQRKEIPGHFRVGKQHRFKRKVVLAWLRNDDSNRGSKR